MSDGSQPTNDDTESLAAADGAPPLGVHVLTEFIFCRRAGLIAFEQRREDTGEEWDVAPRLDFLPDFSVDLIERALQATWNEIWRKLTWAPPVVLVVVVAGGLVNWWISLVLIPILIWLIRWLLDKFGNVLELSRRLSAAREARPNEPAADSTQLQPVNWWELLQAGFTPLEYEEAHEVPAWKLAGRPWRVLAKGSLRIPVFRKRRGKAEIHPQHKARMAAYCQLLEQSEGGQSPYGVVLFGNGHDGLTVPNTAENRRLFGDALRNVRQLLDDVTVGGMMPDIPKPVSVCRNCPLGRPRAHRPGGSETELEGVVLQPYRTRGEDNVPYHSTCGDRFRWVPPHERANERGLC